MIFSSIFCLPWIIVLFFPVRFVYSKEECLHFPKNFSIGAGTSSYQIEGAWNVSDKSKSVWDWFTHQQPSMIDDKSDGDTACNSFYAYKEDVRILNDIGFDHYRFSISWSRILPEGFATKISKDGLKYYNDLLDELIAKKIQPYVTLYHWDHPEILERLGGWSNEFMVEWFADYARVVFRELGPKIKFFITINEPNILCRFGYGHTYLAPGKGMLGIADYICGHNMLKAHARAYHIYDQEFRKDQQGVVGIAMQCFHYFAKDSDEIFEDEAFQFSCGWFSHPIFSQNGDYPEILKEMVAETSKLEGRPKSRLPIFTKNWIDYIRGTADYFGLNHYTSRIVERSLTSEDVLMHDFKVNTSLNPEWPIGKSSWLAVVPEGFRLILRKLKKEYQNPPIYITENGYSDSGDIKDTKRVEYLFAYVKEMLKAIHQDGCNVKAYTVWSLLDNFEWSKGYSVRFGIVHVDFDDHQRKRTMKRSAEWFKMLLQSRELSLIYN